MKFLRHLQRILMCMLLVTCICCTALSGAAEQNVLVDKTATDLDSNEETTVTLNVGGTSSKTISDVVFVLDKSTSQDIVNAALSMLDELMTRVGENRIKAGAVMFNKGSAHKVELAALDEAQYKKIKDCLQNPPESGTNIEAGLRTGVDMLKADTAVAANAKHLVLVSDGVTYMWDEPAQAIYNNMNVDGSEVIWANTTITEYCRIGLDASYIASLRDMKTWMKVNGDGIETVISSYALPYGLSSPSKYYAASKDVYCTADAALYRSGKVWQEAVDAGYQCYSYANPTSKTLTYPYGENFMLGLKTIGGTSQLVPENVTGMFDNVKSSMLYSIERGTVTDVIGKDFDLASLDSFRLTVGGKAIAGAVSGNKVTFANGDTVVYTSGANEKFVWHINNPVDAGAPASLSYTLKLVNKSTDPGIHETPTNEDAKLDYESTGGDKGTVDFPDPVVRYAVTAPVTQTGDNSTPMLWLCLLMLGVSGLMAVRFSQRKHS